MQQLTLLSLSLSLSLSHLPAKLHRDYTLYERKNLHAQGHLEPCDDDVERWTMMITVNDVTGSESEQRQARLALEWVTTLLRWRTLEACLRNK